MNLTKYEIIDSVHVELIQLISEVNRFELSENDLYNILKRKARYLVENVERSYGNGKQR